MTGQTWRRIRRTLTLALLAVSLPLAAARPAPDDPVALVDRYLADLSTLQAQFRQVSLDDTGERMAESSGTLYLSRPGRFRWEYTVPFRQSVVADGERLWIFDSDLEQATVKKLDGSLASNPAMLLSGTGNVGDAFQNGGSFVADDMRWVTLVPRVEDSDFQSIRLGFDGDSLKLMELTDSLDQTTRIEFSDIRRNVPIADKQFVFVVPAGVDVIGDDPLYPAAVAAARKAGRVSTQWLSETLGIDTQRAAGLISAMRDDDLLVAGDVDGALHFRESAPGD